MNFPTDIRKYNLRITSRYFLSNLIRFFNEKAYNRIYAIFTLKVFDFVYNNFKKLVQNIFIKFLKQRKVEI